MAPEYTFDLPTLVVSAFGAILGFLLGLLAFSINEWRKARRERRALAALFVGHIQEVWCDVDALTAAPDGDYFARLTTAKYGVRDLAFAGELHYELEVDNLRLFETHGVKLAGLVGHKARRQMWRCYDLLRKAEAVRVVLKTLPSNETDKTEYRKLFKGLVVPYARELVDLQKLLDKEVTGW